MYHPGRRPGPRALGLPTGLPRRSSRPLVVFGGGWLCLGADGQRCWVQLKPDPLGGVIAQMEPAETDAACEIESVVT